MNHTLMMIPLRNSDGAASALFALRRQVRRILRRSARRKRRRCSARGALALRYRGWAALRESASAAMRGPAATGPAFEAEVAQRQFGLLPQVLGPTGVQIPGPCRVRPALVAMTRPSL